MRSSLIQWLGLNRQQIVVVTALLAGVSTAHASTTPTPTPTPPLPSCVRIPCGGDCVVPAPCTPGTVCPQYVVKGTCEVVSNTCACVTNPLTPVPTPTFGGCGLSCDDRPCLGQCADGSVVQGFCTSLTVDRGCACAFGCGSPTPTPTPFAVCTPPPCKANEVFYCPKTCPGGCGTECATPTQSPTITPTPVGPCASVPCGGACAVCPPCTPGTVCPEAPCRLGTCEMVSGSCACVPQISTPTPTPIPTINECNPSAHNCPAGTECNCCCGTWVCMPPYLPCCALPCSEPTQLPTPTPAAVPCVGDCDQDGRVTVDEIVRMVNIALNGESSPSTCPGSAQWCSSGPVLDAVGITCLIDAVNNALNGCGPTPTPTLALSVRVARSPATQTLQAVADLTNSGEVAVSYLTGCSALCRPKFYQAISFQLIGPHGTEAIVEQPCGGVLACAEGPQAFSPGESVEQTLDITGNEFMQDATTGGECGTCTQAPLEPGRYKVTARFQYSTDLNNPWPFPDYVEASAEFDWP